MPKLLDLKTEAELADFVDSHDMATYWDEMAPVENTRFRVRRHKQTAVRVPLSQATLRQLKSLAAERQMPLDELLREWLSQWLQHQPVAGS